MQFDIILNYYGRPNIMSVSLIIRCILLANRGQRMNLLQSNFLLTDENGINYCKRINDKMDTTISSAFYTYMIF